MVTTGLMEHGVQEIYEENDGNIALLRIDPLTKSARFDALAAENLDVLAAAIPAGLRRLTYTVADGVITWYGATGAAWAPNELVTGDTAKNYMPALALVDGKWKLTWRVIPVTPDLSVGHYVMLAKPTLNIDGTVEKLSFEMVLASDFLARLTKVEADLETDKGSIASLAETDTDHEERIDNIETSNQSGTEAPTTGTWQVGARLWNASPSLGSPVGWVCVTAGEPGTWEPFGRVSVDTIGAAAPTEGTWRRGDRCWDSTPTSGSQVGWVCVAGGTPGTWKSFGAIS